VRSPPFRRPRGRSWKRSPTRTRERHERLRQTVSTLQESLDYLRLSIKYLVFDLEATRRENGYLRKMLKRPRGTNKFSSSGSTLRAARQNGPEH